MNGPCEWPVSYAACSISEGQTNATTSTAATKVGFTAGGDTGGAVNAVVWDNFAVTSA